MIFHDLESIHRIGNLARRLSAIIDEASQPYYIACEDASVLQLSHSLQRSSHSDIAKSHKNPITFQQKEEGCFLNTVQCTIQMYCQGKKNPDGVGGDANFPALLPQILYIHA